MLPMGNNSTGVVSANGKAARIQHRMPIARHGDRRFSELIKNGAAYAGYNGLLAFLAIPSRAGLKKFPHLPALAATLASPVYQETLELDELWSFIARKSNQAWIWIALCRRTRQVVAYALGDRSQRTCRRLWRAIPAAYRTGLCFTDFWRVYQAVVPEDQHRAVGKDTGQTAHVERWNNTLRQRLARFVRLTLSFSKSAWMHEACLVLFLHRYNADCAILLY
jgi:insertion element IS1 protein InsB